MTELIIFEPPQSSTIMTKIKDIIQYLESFAPPAYQEDYDNSGLIVGNKNNTLAGALITLDCTEQVVEEAVKIVVVNLFKFLENNKDKNDLCFRCQLFCESFGKKYSLKKETI